MLARRMGRFSNFSPKCLGSLGNKLKAAIEIKVPTIIRKVVKCQLSPMASKQFEIENVENKTISRNELSSDLWKTITAFSNSDGGLISLGIDPKGERVGVNPAVIDKLQADTTTLCSSGFNHRLYPGISTDKDNVINIYIPPVPAQYRPIFSTSRGLPRGAKVRVGTSNVQVDDEWIRRFAISARGGAELMPFKKDYKEYLDISVIQKYLDIVTMIRGNVYENLSIDRILVKLRALTDKKEITLFGLLAFSNATGLQELTAPTVNIAVTHYAGTSKINPDDIAEVSLDDREFSGNVVNQFEESLKFIESKLPVKSRIDEEGKRKSYLAIPNLALREILANAIVHRDYKTFKGRIQVDVYNDRIEFANPGRSLIPLELLETAHPETRNPLLMNYMRDLKITEHRGRGIRTIKSSLKAAGLAEPTFVHRHDWFVATIFSSAFIRDDDQIWLQQFQEFKLNGRQLNALVHVKYNPDGINNSEYRNLNNMTNVGDDIRAKKELVKLTKFGILNKVGEKRYRRYTLS
jgi:ATP-dependent DNA helicase RecG